jgi:hypothetical protein
MENKKMDQGCSAHLPCATFQSCAARTLHINVIPVVDVPVVWETLKLSAAVSVENASSVSCVLG